MKLHRNYYLHDQHSFSRSKDPMPFLLTIARIFIVIPRLHIKNYEKRLIYNVAKKKKKSGQKVALSYNTVTMDNRQFLLLNTSNIWIVTCCLCSHYFTQKVMGMFKGYFESLWGNTLCPNSLQIYLVLFEENKVLSALCKNILYFPSFVIYFTTHINKKQCEIWGHV